MCADAAQFMSRRTSAPTMLSGPARLPEMGWLPFAAAAAALPPPPWLNKAFLLLLLLPLLLE